jgi:hypothetical protein
VSATADPPCVLLVEAVLLSLLDADFGQHR